MLHRDAVAGTRTSFRVDVAVVRVINERTRLLRTPSITRGFQRAPSREGLETSRRTLTKTTEEAVTA